MKRSRIRESLQDLDDIDQLDIEKIISDAFDQAVQLTERLELSNLLKEHGVFDLDSMSKYVFQQLNSSSKMFDYSTQMMIAMNLTLKKK
ncbi:unnamed protein product [Didymodactylos carnosus]|uniref:Uncharacterized protein n=1 Tax=Didymodactylos carnosus TaxID=1234261 RepID=A0A815EF03_9BILA|nr:unnamed protein product [Didymodactylos carnosus]CAF1364096.1 unnamed protein product [Didymodactylos carnosus]CAF4145302.1 unnamed protein product [Didymodactylos carnosus]CAF4173609.1 unnamed protein product [Didymodactylos carnosus]